MNKQTEALKLALEALENNIDLVEEDYANAVSLYGNYPSRAQRLIGMETMRDDHRKAITAIREALAEQPAAQWIGLDELDWDDILEQAGTFGSVIRLTEAKLREKNAQPAALAINWEPLQEFWRNNSQHVDWDELEAAVNAMLAAAPEQKGGAA